MLSKFLSEAAIRKSCSTLGLVAAHIRMMHHDLWSWLHGFASMLSLLLACTIAGSRCDSDNDAFMSSSSITYNGNAHTEQAPARKPTMKMSRQSVKLNENLVLRLEPYAVNGRRGCLDRGKSCPQEKASSIYSPDGQPRRTLSQLKLLRRATIEPSTSSSARRRSGRETSLEPRSLGTPPSAYLSNDALKHLHRAEDDYRAELAEFEGLLQGKKELERRRAAFPILRRGGASWYQLLDHLSAAREAVARHIRLVRASRQAVEAAREAYIETSRHERSQDGHERRAEVGSR